MTTNYKIVKTKDLRLNPDIPVFFDTETEGLYGKIRLAQFFQQGWECPKLVDKPDYMELSYLLSTAELVGHNISYDLSIISDGLGKLKWCPWKVHDTLILSRLVYPYEKEFALNNCIFYALGYDPYENIDKKAMQKAKWDDLILDAKQLEYAAMDVAYLHLLWKRLITYPIFDSSLYTLDMLTIGHNIKMQCNGMPVDSDKLNNRWISNKAAIDKVGLTINVNSPKQACLYINSDTSKDEKLAELISQGDERALEVRTVRKLTKENSFLKKFTSDDNKIYGHFSPTAKSGRSRCSNQNLQQLPRNTKDCFGVAKDSGNVMVYSDFSQLELRCICALTGDPNMTALFRSGKDVHTHVAQKLFGTEVPTTEQRRIAKTCNFGLLYGAGVDTFSRILLVSTGIVLDRDRAAELIKDWKNLFPKIKLWQREGIEAWKDGKLWFTPMGRGYKGFMMTEQLNIQVQGMGAEVAKLANHYMNQRSTINDWVDYQVNFIHDSYLFVMPIEHAEKACKLIAESMKAAWVEISRLDSVGVNVKVKDLPMPVEVLVGYNWADIDNGTEIIRRYTK